MRADLRDSDLLMFLPIGPVSPVPATLQQTNVVLYGRGRVELNDPDEWSRAQRNRQPLSMLTIDIDHFRSVNDRYGRAVGDPVIVSAANACRNNKRNLDVVGRLAGE